MVNFLTFSCVCVFRGNIFWKKNILNFKQRTPDLILAVTYPSIRYVLRHSFTIIRRMSDTILLRFIFLISQFFSCYGENQTFSDSFVAAVLLLQLMTLSSLACVYNHTYCHMITWKYIIFRFFCKFFHGLILFGLVYKSMQQAYLPCCKILIVVFYQFFLNLNMRWDNQHPIMNVFQNGLHLTFFAGFQSLFKLLGSYQ